MEVFQNKAANMEAAHMKSVDELKKYFKVDDTEGLSKEAVEEALEKYGPNGKFFSMSSQFCGSSSVMPWRLYGKSNYYEIR